MTLIQKCINVITKPTTCWDGIKTETETVKGIIVPFALIMAIIPAAANFLSYPLSWIGFNAFSTTLISTILYYALFLFEPLLLAFVFSLLAPNFGGSKDLAKATQLAYYSFIPAYIGSIFFLFMFMSPGLVIIGSLVSIYSLVLLYFGAKKMLDIPQDKYVAFIVISIIATGVLFWLLTFIVNQVTGYNDYARASAVINALGSYGNLLTP